MDPITGLGLAANILQFLHFTSGLLSSAQKLYVSASGASADCQHLENVYSRLSELNVALQTSQSTNASRGQLSSQWDNLIALAQKCDSDCQELLSATAKLKTKNAPKRRWWQCFQKALLEVWTREDILRIKSRIGDYQASITIYLCAMSAEGIEAIKLDLDHLRADTRTLHARRTQQLELLVHSMAHVSRELIAIKGSSFTDGGRLDEMEVLTGKLAGLCLDRRRLAVEQNILTSLDFAHRGQRQMAIPDAHTDTFRWVSETQSDVTSGPGRLATWLQEGSGVFWVSGKPGSGKSTFMKHITHNEHARAALSRWAGPKQLVVASYYFWSAGQPLQKSLYGLLRSLLYDTLDQVPGMSHDVCSQRRDADDQGKIIGKEWSLSELHDCLQNLPKQNTLHSRFCFFIDGLDEYEGDHIEICRTLLTLCQSADFKICVSSRPWNIFENELGKNECQKLYIHELTHDDIRKYVMDRLHQHPQWPEACSEDVRSQTLVDEVTGRSQGVFLWVFLVTRQLREGLVNGDTFDDLLKRLESIPTDLEQFFKQILDSVDPFYHVSMARTLQIALCAEGNLSVAIFAFHNMEHHDTDYALNQPLAPFTPDEMNQFLGPTRRRLNGLCKGLLEIQYGRVQFLHRTLWDFLMTGEMASYLSEKAGPQFRATTSWLKAYVAFIKRSRIWCDKSMKNQPAIYMEIDSSSGEEAHDLLSTLLGYARRIQGEENKDFHVANRLLDETELCLMEKSRDDIPLLRSRYEAMCMFRQSVVREQLAEYLLEKLTDEPEYLSGLNPPPLLILILLHSLPGLSGFERLTWETEANLWTPRRLKTLTTLLEHGISANETYVVEKTGAVSTSWHELVCSLQPFRHESHDPTDHGLYLNPIATAILQSAFDSGAITTLLQHGADINAPTGTSAGLSQPVWLRFFLLVFFNPDISRFTDSYIQVLRAMMLSATDFTVLFQENLRSQEGDSSRIISPWKALCDQLQGLDKYTFRSDPIRQHLRLCSQAIKVLALTAAGKVRLPWSDIRSILESLFGWDFLDQLPPVPDHIILEKERQLWKRRRQFWGVCAASVVAWALFGLYGWPGSRKLPRVIRR